MNISKQCVEYDKEVKKWNSRKISTNNSKIEILLQNFSNTR